MKFRKERDILEFLPIALYSTAMVVKSGGSLEKGLQFVATRDFGRVSRLFQRVLDVALMDTLEKGLDSIKEESNNRCYREALITMQQYARYGSSVGDRLVAIGNMMEREAVMKRRNHLIRVKNSLVTQTLALLCAIPFLLIVITLVLTRPFAMQQGEPPLQKEHVEMMIYCWIALLAIAYPILYVSYIYRNPVFMTPRLKDLQRMFGSGLDGPISRFLDNVANHIEMGWSLETAFPQALPYQLSTHVSGDEILVRRAILSLSDPNLTFSQALHGFAGLVNHRKFDLSVEFIDLARKNKYASVGETLHLLADSFWKSHITAQHYQTSATIPAAASLLLKGGAMFFLGGLFPFFLPLLFFFFLVDVVLITLALL
ncbi:MAG: type II secretion system F family protein [Thermoplasmata archaeon]|nr:type II secretion system F family protein [Thermoplasmata archaeon]